MNPKTILPSQRPTGQEDRTARLALVTERAEQHRAYLEDAAGRGDLLACVALLVLDRVSGLIRDSGRE